MKEYGLNDVSSQENINEALALIDHIEKKFQFFLNKPQKRMKPRARLTGNTNPPTTQPAGYIPQNTSKIG